jgi:type IV secretion system protein VirB2
MQQQNPSQQMSKHQRWLFLAGLGLALGLVPELASATVLDNFGTALLGILNNTFLRSVAILAIMGAGLMALSGRIEWSKFLIVLLAVVIVFGAAGIVDYIKAQSATAALDTSAIYGHFA